MTALPAPLATLAHDPAVTDILVNNGVEVWVERAGHLQRVDDLASGLIDAHLERLLAPLGRRLDRLSPMVDARLDDGTRVCAVIAPIAVGGTCVAFRLFRPDVHALDDFGVDERVWQLLVEPRGNLLVSGATGSGKTSLVASLLEHRPVDERLVIIEDTHELPVRTRHAVRLEARPANAEGRGHVGLDDLLRTALRLRPDRIIVGEVRGPEALTLVQAMNTGHVGSMSTVHANSAVEALERIDLLVSQAAPNWRLDDVRRLVSRAFGTVVHLVRRPDGRRVIDHVIEVHHRDERVHENVA